MITIRDSGQQLVIIKTVSPLYSQVFHRSGKEGPNLFLHAHHNSESDVVQCSCSLKPFTIYRLCLSHVFSLSVSLDPVSLNWARKGQV